MAMTRMRTIFPAFLAVTLLSMAFAPAAKSDPIQATATYSTTGTIGTTGVNGMADVAFQGVSDGTLTTGQPFSLGQFVLGNTPGGVPATYDNTPFQITVAVSDVRGIPSSAGGITLTLKGILQTVTESGNTLTQAEFAPAMGAFGSGPISPDSQPIFIDHSFIYDIYPTTATIDLSRSIGGGEAFEVKAQLDTYNTPEPTALATFVAAVVGLGLKHRFGSSKRSGRVRPRGGEAGL